jgi:hypothetical protein
LPDQRLQLGYGSAWHLLRCLGWQRARFTEHVARSICVNTINWLDFPLGGKGVYPTGVPIRDGEWKRINFATQMLQDLYEWPTLGEQQNWDAVGFTTDAKSELILVEAKAHPAEIKFNGTTASENGGRPLIRSTFRKTLKACGFTDEAADIRAEAWLTGCYQYANRISTLQFYNANQIPARLVFLYFCGDQHPSGTFCPQSPAGWDEPLNQVKQVLGLNGTGDLETRIHNVFVDVNTIIPGIAP